MNTVPKIDQARATPVKTDSFTEAFLKLQASIRPAIKDASNPAFRSKYADFSAVMEAVRGPMHENGFVLVQRTDFDSSDMWLETIIMHVGGEKIAARYPLRPIKQDPQGFGSALTYAKRYSLSALLGVVADEDDDGNAASGVNGHSKPATPPGKVNADQVGHMRTQIERTGTDIEAFCRHFKIEALPDMPIAKYATAMEMLNVKASKQ